MVSRADPGGIYARNVKAAGIGTVAALTPDVSTLFVGVLIIAVAHSLDGQCIAIERKVDIFLLKAGQVGLQQERIAGIPDIGFEFGQRGIEKEGTVPGLQLMERVVTTVQQHSHNAYLLFYLKGFEIFRGPVFRSGKYDDTAQL